MDPGRPRVRWPLARSRRDQRHPLQPARPRGGPRGDRERRVDEIWCLGDVVGYGADPDACAELSASAATSAWSATTTSPVLGELDISAFSEAAAEAVEWTRDRIGEPALEFLGELAPTGRQQQGIGLFHASPRDPVWEYVLSIEQAEACLDAQPERIGADRPLPRRALLHPPRRATAPPRPAATRPRTGCGSTSPSGAGCSTPAASASRATATRAPPGWSSTPRSGRRASTASPTTSTAPPPRSSRLGLPKRLADRLHIGQ